MIIPIPVPARSGDVVVGYPLSVLANSTATTRGRDARQFAILRHRWLDHAERPRVKAFSMKLTMTRRDELIAAYRTDEPLKSVVARFGVSESYLFRLIRHPPQRIAVCTRMKIHQLKRMVERQNRLLVIKQGDAASAVQALLAKQITTKNTDLRSARDIHKALGKDFAGTAMAAMSEVNLPVADLVELPGKFPWREVAAE